MCANDLLALGSLQRLHEHGINVPADVSVAGFDDIPVAAMTAPSLSTVRIPLRELGRRGFDAAVRALGGEPLEPVVLPTQVVLARFNPRYVMEQLNLRGIIPACVVTFDADGKFDEAQYRRYLQWLLPQGPVALAINADTGEGPHLWPTSARRSCAWPSTRQTRPAASRSLPACRRCSRHRRWKRASAPAMRARVACSSSRSRPTRACHSTRQCRSPTTRRSPRASVLPMVAFQLQPALGGVIFSEDTLRQIAAIDNVVALKEASFDARLYL
jgi:hypothetical protein